MRTQHIKTLHEGCMAILEAIETAHKRAETALKDAAIQKRQGDPFSTQKWFEERHHKYLAIADRLTTSYWRHAEKLIAAQEKEKARLLAQKIMSEIKSEM